MNNFNTQDYDFLLKTLSQGSLIFKSQSLKRLLMLAINDKKQFTLVSKQILCQLQLLYDQDKQDINLNATLILSEIVSSIGSRQHQPIIMNSHIQKIIKNLGHTTKPGVRKASHTFLLAFLRSYNNFNSLIKAYTHHGLNHQSSLIRQKAINSLQSILILELKKFDWQSDQSKELLQALIVMSRDQNGLVSKASAQCLVSMSKIQEISALVQRLSIGFLSKFKDFLQHATQTLNAGSLRILPQEVQSMIQGHRKPKKIQQQQIIIIQPQIRKFQRPSQKDIQTIRNSSSNNNTQRRLDKIRNSIKEKNQKSSMLEKQSNQSKLFGNIVLEGSIKEKTDAAQELLFKIQSNLDRPDLQAAIKVMLPSLIKMLKDTNPKIVGITLKILESIIQFVNPKDRNFSSLLSVIVQKLGDAKISIRQSVCKVIKDLISKTKKGVWIHELVQNMKKNTNTYLRDQTLGLILNIFQQTPKQQIDYDFQELLDSIVVYSDDPKTKIKIRTLDCLAQIVVVSEQPQKYTEDLRAKMPKIFHQMFLQKVNKLLKQRYRLTQYKPFNETSEIRQQFSTTSRTAYIQKPNSSHIRNQSQGEDKNKMNVSMQIVKRRVSLLKKPRKLMSTQQTTSVNNHSQKTIDRTLDNTIEDLEVVLPSLYKKTATNRFIGRKLGENGFSPNKTIDHKNQSSDYLSKEELTPLNQPGKEFKLIMAALKNSDWKMLFETTNRLRRLIQFDSDLVLNSGQASIHNVIMEVLAMVQNLRSSVSKNALLCLNQLIIVLNRQIDSDAEIIFDRVIKKSADANVFISAEVQKVMKTLTTQASSYKILQKIGQFKDSKSIPIKETCVNCLLSMRQEPIIREKQFTKLTQTFAYFLFDGNQQIRNKSKTGIALICNDLGDWYRSLRGKINAGYFKSVCQIMTKAPNLAKQNSQRYSTIQNSPNKVGRANRQDYSTIKSEKIVAPVPESPLKSQKMEVTKKRVVKISNFPQQFEQIQGFIQQCNSSDWKKRIQFLNKFQELALQYQNQFVQYRSANHFIDTICKQISQPNTKVSHNAMSVLQKTIQPLRTLVENNLSLICNSVFNCLSSNKVQIKQKSQDLTTVLLEEIQISMILQYLTHGIMYSLPKSRIYLTFKLKQKLQTIFKQKKQLIFKYIFPLMNKLMDQYKSQMIPSMVQVFNKIYELMGNQMYSHLTKFKQVKELIY